MFEVAVSEQPGTVSERHRLSRRKFLDFLVHRKPAVVLLEACGSAHFWGRKAAELGHQPVLLPPREVRRYVRRNKTDRADAKALLEARRNEVEPSEEAWDFPTIADGVRGMEFIEAVVASSAAGAVWTPLASAARSES